VAGYHHAKTVCDAPAKEMHMSEYWTFPKCTFQEKHVFPSSDIGQAGFELSECGHVGGILLLLGNLELLHFHVARSFENAFAKQGNQHGCY